MKRRRDKATERGDRERRQRGERRDREGRQRGERGDIRERGDTYICLSLSPIKSFGRKDIAAPNQLPKASPLKFAMAVSMETWQAFSSQKHRDIGTAPPIA